MQIELATTVKQSTEQVSCNLNGEIAILNLKSTLYFRLDEVGACIWGLWVSQGPRPRRKPMANSRASIRAIVAPRIRSMSAI
jgi:hypothetical protein